MRIITSLEDLRTLASSKAIEVRLVLNGGFFSRKTIRFDAKKVVWRVMNHIDGSRQTLTDAELWTHSNIGKGLDRNALVLVED